VDYTNKLKYSGVKLVLAVIAGITVWLSIALGFFWAVIKIVKLAWGA
jgi:hypothetical protein